MGIVAIAKNQHFTLALTYGQWEEIMAGHGEQNEKGMVSETFALKAIAVASGYLEKGVEL